MKIRIILLLFLGTFTLIYAQDLDFNQLNRIRGHRLKMNDHSLTVYLNKKIGKKSELDFGNQ